MKRTRLLSIGLSLVVLMISSAWIGAAIALRRAAAGERMRPGMPPAAMLINHLDRLDRLPGLSEDQRLRLAPVIRQARRDIQDLARNSHDRAMAIRGRLRTELESILTPEQRATLSNRTGLFRGRLFERVRGGAGFPNPAPEPPDAEPEATP